MRKFNFKKFQNEVAVGQCGYDHCAEEEKSVNCKKCGRDFFRSDIENFDEKSFCLNCQKCTEEKNND